jgi:hypothetical protein
LRLKTKVDGLLVVWPQNHWDGFFGLDSKPVAAISPSFASKSLVGFMVEPQNQGGGGFSVFGLKIGSYSLVIWVSKSPRRLLGLSLKTKRVTVYQLLHKTDGMM